LDADNSRVDRPGEPASEQALAEESWRLRAYAASLELRIHELELSRAQLAQVVAATADAVMVVDGDHRIILVNPALERLVDLPASELVGKRYCPYTLGARRADGTSPCDTVCPFHHSAESQVAAVDVRITTSDSRELWVSVAYGPIRDSEGRIQAVVHTIRDISDRKELEAAKDQFLSVVNHEVKGPLTAAKGYAQLLLKRAELGRTGQDGVAELRAIDRQVSRACDLVDRLLDVSRAQLGRLRLHPEEVDLAALVRDVAAQVQMTTSGHELVVRAEKPVMGCWDPGRLEEVFHNLLGNAVKYSPSGGGVEIEVERVAEQALVSVRDHGIGIAEGARKRLFEPYYRAVDHGSRVEGLGLGLYICRQIIEAHDGRIWLESAVGEGTCVHLCLPAQLEQPSRFPLL
jgi:PAS domain S-box-containing protein